MANDFGVSFNGLNKLRAMVKKKTGAALKSRLADAIAAEMEIEATEARKRTPVDTGALRASIHVTEPVVSGREVSCSVVAGGPAAPYAVKVHEDLEAFHRTGEAKFLQSVMEESEPYIAARVARRLQESAED